MDEKQLASQLYRHLKILATLTVVFLVVLAAAPLKWQISEWRDIQKDYNRQAQALGMSPMNVGLQQIWRPEIKLTDRCTSCHVGMGAAPPLESGGPLFGPHPAVHHNTARMGCTICHRGQGRATTHAAAHGEVKHWEDPMLPREHLQAACGSCHGDAVRTPALAAIEQGRYLFELHGCQACHVVDGEGGGVGPDLSGVALKGFDRAWHIRHLRDPAALVEGSQMMSFGHLKDDEIDAVLTYLDTLIGAPKLVRGKAVAVARGCRGCHKIGGLGGDLGIDLAEAADRPESEYDFSGVEGEHTIVNWHRQHLRQPRRVAPGSQMPAYHLPAGDEDALITYILSLRRPDVPMEELPRQTVMAHFEERRDFVQDGPVLFGAFCAACHGAEGRGQVMPSLDTTVPDLRNPETLSVMSEDALRYIVEHGRPGRPMPAWGLAGAGLKEEEINAIVAYVRADLPSPPAYAEVEASKADITLGGLVYEGACAACHGGDASGTEIAPSLNAPELHFAGDDRYFYDTITGGRPGTAMPAHPAYDARTLASLIGWIRRQGAAELEERRPRMEQTIRDVLFVDQLSSYRAAGSATYGEVLYTTTCQGCHGVRARGGLGPAIGNPSFLKVASDGFLAGTIVLGRSGRAMQSFGPHGLAVLARREVGDVIAYLRSVGGKKVASKQVGSQPPAVPGYATVQGTTEHGRELFGQYCVGCHGESGKGLTAPALNNQAFLDSVSDGFLQATLVKGRPGTAMRSWARGGFGFAELEPTEINDIVTYIRSWHTDSH